MDLEFTHRKSYGRDRFYANNETTEFLLKLMKVQTLPLETLKELKEFGWGVKVTYEPFEL